MNVMHKAVSSINHACTRWTVNKTSTGIVVMLDFQMVEHLEGRTELQWVVIKSFANTVTVPASDLNETPP